MIHIAYEQLFTEVYLHKISMRELFARVSYRLKAVDFHTKISIADDWYVPKYASGSKKSLEK